MATLVDRRQFRTILREVVKCLRQNLDVPGISPVNAGQMLFWLQNVTLEDLQTVARELDGGKAAAPSSQA